MSLANRLLTIYKLYFRNKLPVFGNIEYMIEIQVFILID